MKGAKKSKSTTKKQGFTPELDQNKKVLNLRKNLKKADISALSLPHEQRDIWM
jgi:hypothetical protein